MRGFLRSVGCLMSLLCLVAVSPVGTPSTADWSLEIVDCCIRPCT